MMWKTCLQAKIVYSNMANLMQSSCKSFEIKIIFGMMLLMYKNGLLVKTQRFENLKVKEKTKVWIYQDS